MVVGFHTRVLGLVAVIGLAVCLGVVSALQGTLGAQFQGQQQQQQQHMEQQHEHRMEQQEQLAACRGLGRVKVDWWIMLKHPAGYQYSYVDSSILANLPIQSCEAGSCWRHRLSMLNPNPVSHTLALLAPTPAAQAAAGPLAYVMYNDADPAGTEHWQFAHAKGVAAFSPSSSSSSAQGFWLVHSAPRFPRSPSDPEFAQLQRPQSVFGQHFFCISLAGVAALSAVSELLLASGPYIYSSNLPAAAATELPAWAQLIANSNSSCNSTCEQRMHDAVFSTAAGQQLHGFAKTQLFNASLTDGVVVPGLGCDMLWETWRRSGDALPSFCPAGPAQHQSLNIAAIAFPGWPYRWQWAQDHSKWGVSSNSVGRSPGDRQFFGSSNSSQQVVCFGDLNRAFWQSRRGGQYVCLQHAALWQALSSIVAEVEPCSS